MNLVLIPESLRCFLKAILRLCFYWEAYSEAYLEAYSEENGTSRVKLFAKIVNSWKPLTNCDKSSILGVWLDYEYATTNKHQVISTSWYRLFSKHW